MAVNKPVRRTEFRQELIPYVSLWTHSHYSFLDSTLSPAAIVRLAKRHGLSAVSLTDTGNLHGVVEFVNAAKAAAIKPIIGSKLQIEGKPLLLLVESPAGYPNLCRLLSHHAERAANEDSESSVAAQERSDFLRHELDGFTSRLIAVSPDESLSNLFPNSFYRMATTRNNPTKFPSVACAPVHYAEKVDRQKFDIVQSIRTLTLLRERHPEKKAGGRLHFRTPLEMNLGCKDHLEWLRATSEIADRCNFEFPLGKPQFPAFHPPDGATAHNFLNQLVLEGLRRRYGCRSEKFRPQVIEELSIIS